MPPQRFCTWILLLSVAFPVAAIAGSSARNGRRPVLMISVDGLRPDYVTQANAHGLTLPILSSFMKNGCYADGVRGVLPTVTFPSHITLVTGVWPATHGIYNNTLFDPLRSHPGQWYWYEPDIKATTLWHVASKAGIRTASVFWPVTVNAPDIDDLVPAYPVRTVEDSNLMEAISRPDGYLRSIEKTTGPFYIASSGPSFDELLTKTSIAIIKDKKPGFMTVHLVSLDSAEHATGPFSAKSDASIEAIDGMIGRMSAAERANDPDALVVVVSDHGFAEVHARVNLLVPFVKAGLITLGHDAQGGGPTITSWKASMWNADGSAYIILRDPNDIGTLRAVKDLLDGLERDPNYGIARILTHEEIVAQGGDPAASFLVAWKPGFETGNALEGKIVDPVTGVGTHGYLPGFPQMRSSFFVTGTGIARGRDLGVIDMRSIAPTVAHLLGIHLTGAGLPLLSCDR